MHVCMHVCMHVGPLGLRASEHCNCPSCSASLTSSSPWYPSWHNDANPLDPSFCGSYEFGGKELWLGIWLVGLRLELQLEWQLEWLGLKWPEMDQDGLYGSNLFLCITTCLLLPAVVGVVAAVAGCVAACCVWLADCCRPHVRASAILLELRRSCLFIFEHCEAVAGILLFHRHCEAVDVDALQLIPARPCLCSLATTGPA